MKKNYTRLSIYIVLLITALCFIPLRSLKFEFNIEKLFPAGDPDLALFQEFQHNFQSHTDDEFIYIGLWNNEGIFQKDFLVRTDSLTKFIQRLDNIIRVYSLTSSNLIFFRNEEINARPLIHIDQPELYPEDSVYLFASREFRDLLVSKDGRSIAIAAFNKQNLTDDQKDQILDQISQKMEELDFDRTHLTAKIRMERTYIQEIARNFRTYLVISLVLICIALFLMFRSLRGMLVPLLVIGISLIWSLSLIVVTGHSLDIISSLIPPILAAICMSDIIHITTKYIEELRTGIPKNEALKKTYREVGMATFFTCITVAIGFITLGITNIIPIRNFGFFAAAGIVMAFIITMVILYGFYSFTPVPSIVYRKAGELKWNRFLSSMLKGVIRNKYIVLAALVIITSISAYYTSKVEINSRMLQEIPRNNPILGDYKFMEQDFAGTRPFEMSLSVSMPGKTFYDIDVMKKLEEIETYLKDSCGVGYLISPLSLFKGANKAFHGGSNEQFTIPASPQLVSRYYESISQTEYADELQHYMLTDGSMIRISGRLPDLSIKEFQVLSAQFERFFKNGNYGQYFSYHLTGSAVLLDKIVYSLTENLFTGLWIDALLISVIALLLLRNWRIVLITLIPNVVPLLIMGGVMGAMGINLKADTSVIFAIAFGIAVDDTIHFLSRIRIELDKGLSLPYAVKRSYLSTGKAMIITTLVLLTGFLTLLSSSFGGTFYIGLLISICLGCAVILDLTVLPVLLLLFYKRKENQIRRARQHDEYHVKR